MTIADLIEELLELDPTFDVMIYKPYGYYTAGGTWKPLEAVDVDETGRKVHIG